MKKLFLIAILFVISLLGSPTKSFAQTDRELLLELIKQQTELSKQVAEISKQQAVTNSKVESLEKSMDKRFEAQINYLLGMLGFIAVLIGSLVWDRRAANTPLETKTNDLKIENLELKREINLLKEKELKHEEKELKLEKRLLKNENNFKRIAEIDPRFANIS